MTIQRKLTKIVQNEDGVAAIEFGLIGTVFLMMLLAGFDFGHSLYMQTVVEGSLQEAGRASTLQSGSDAAAQATLDAKIISQVRKLNRTANIQITRRFYKSFTDALAAAHEHDINSATPAKNDDGTCEHGETFLDANNNGVYDVDGGNAGQGGAQDMVVYKATVSYPRLFPLTKLFGFSDQVKIVATTVLQNQPFSAQAEYSTTPTRNCP